MRIALAFLLFGLILIGCSQRRSDATTTTAPLTIEKKWYEGGTLHQSTIREWKSATAENKLATCGDFMAKLDNSVSMDELRSRAVALRACIDTATRGLDSMDNDKVAEVAALCTVTLGYK